MVTEVSAFVIITQVSSLLNVSSLANISNFMQDFMVAFGHYKILCHHRSHFVMANVGPI